MCGRHDSEPGVGLIDTIFYISRCQKICAGHSYDACLSAPKEHLIPLDDSGHHNEGEVPFVHSERNQCVRELIR